MKELNFDKLEKMNFYGTDVSLDISLYEYGLLARTWEKSEGTYQFIYVVDYHKPTFDITVISDDDVNETFDDMDDGGLLSFVGMNETEWKELDIIHKVSDLIQYYGLESVFGSSYYGTMDSNELNEWIDNN